MSKMLDEIREQPAALERTLGSALRQALALRKRLEGRPPRLVVLAARGTSDNAAQFGRYLIEVTLGVPVSLAAPSVFTLYRAALDLKDALVAGISQSGESTDTNSFLEHARRRGALTVGITNEARSAMARLVDFPLVVRAGRERSVAATKTSPARSWRSISGARPGRTRAAGGAALPARSGVRGAAPGGARGRAGRALPVHGTRCGGRPGLSVRQHSGVRAEADGDLPGGGGPFFRGGPVARTHRHGLAVVSGVPVRAARPDGRLHADHPRRPEAAPRRTVSSRTGRRAGGAAGFSR
jgi:hypothetical protein